MQQKLFHRPKPELPKPLAKYQIFYNKLGAPMGPKYMGNYEFEIDGLPRSVTLEIKETLKTASVLEVTEDLIRRGFAIRWETVAAHKEKVKGEKLWTITSTQDYVKRFENMYNIKGQGKQHGTLPQIAYKPFVVWAIENGYEHYQIAQVLEYAPSTIRQWANDYGYKEYTRTVAKAPDFTGKEDRTELRREPGIHIDNGTHSILSDRDTPSEGIKFLRKLQEEFPQDEADRKLGALVRNTIANFEQLGYDATITLNKIHIINVETISTLKESEGLN